jgi:hypothetical protein
MDLKKYPLFINVLSRLKHKDVLIGIFLVLSHCILMVYMASPQKKQKKQKHACFSYDLARSDMDVIEHSTDETQDH